jgi:hypothetical protein
MNGPNNNRIEVRPNSSPRYRLYNSDYSTYNNPWFYSFTSSDGVTWTAFGKKPVSITLSGFTGASAQSNGTYSAFEWDPNNLSFLGYKGGADNSRVVEIYPSGEAGAYILSPTFFVSAQKSTGWGIGSWTIEEGTGSPVGTGTLYPTGGVPTGAVTTTTVNTDSVTAWADQSGNGNNCSSPNAVVLNSSPYSYLYFGGDNSESEITLHPNVFNNFSALSLFAVWSITDGQNQGILGSTNNSNFEIATQDGSVVRMRNNNDDYNINTGGLWYAEEFCLSTITADSAGNGSGTARRNGSTTGVNFDDANIQALQGGQTYKIGSYSGGLFANLSLAELIVYSQKLNGSQIDQVEGYLNAKYGIY